MPACFGVAFGGVTRRTTPEAAVAVALAAASGAGRGASGIVASAQLVEEDVSETIAWRGCLASSSFFCKFLRICSSCVRLGGAFNRADVAGERVVTLISGGGGARGMLSAVPAPLEEEACFSSGCGGGGGGGEEGGEERGRDCEVSVASFCILAPCNNTIEDQSSAGVCK